MKVFGKFCGRLQCFLLMSVYMFCIPNFFARFIVKYTPTSNNFYEEMWRTFDEILTWKNLHLCYNHIVSSLCPPFCLLQFSMVDQQRKEDLHTNQAPVLKQRTYICFQNIQCCFRLHSNNKKFLSPSLHFLPLCVSHLMKSYIINDHCKNLISIARPLLFKLFIFGDPHFLTLIFLVTLQWWALWHSKGVKIQNWGGIPPLHWWNSIHMIKAYRMLNNFFFVQLLNFAILFLTPLSQIFISTIFSPNFPHPPKYLATAPSRITTPHGTRQHFKVQIFFFNLHKNQIIDVWLW